MADALTNLRHELRRAFRGDILSGPVPEARYSSDSGPFHVPPAAIAFPTSEADLRALIPACAEFGFHLVPRGAGTGRAGGAVGAGIVVDLSRHLRAVLDIGEDRVRVQAGLPIDVLNRALAKQGRRLPRAFRERPVGTVGGRVATVRLGSSLLASRWLFDSGEAIDFPMKEPVGILTELEALYASHVDAIRSSPCPIGYDLASGPDHRPDFARLFAGSQGTLGILTECTLATEPLPTQRVCLVSCFDHLEDALNAAASMEGASEILIIDRRTLSFLKNADGLPTRECEAALLAEWEGDSVPASGVFIEPAIWDNLRRAIERVPHRDKRPGPVAALLDARLPVERILPFVRAMRSHLAERSVPASLRIELPLGRVSFHPLLDDRMEEERAKLFPLAEAVVHEALAAGGTVTDGGLLTTPWMERLAGPFLPVFTEIKRIADPKGIFNRGKMVGLDPSQPAWPLAAPRVSLELADECNGCGTCKSVEPFGRMCPSFRVLGIEEASPRAMARAARTLIGKGPRELPPVAELRETAKHCIQCGQCKKECPAEADIPRMMLDLRSHIHEEGGRTWTEWFLSRSDRWLRWAAGLRTLGNPLTRGPLHALLSRAFGISREIKLPPFRRPFLPKRLAKEPRPTEGPEVLLLPGRHAHYFEPEIGVAVFRLLAKHGFRVAVPTERTPNAARPFFQGDRAYAARLLRSCLPEWIEAARRGAALVCIEPTDALFLREYLPMLLPDEPDAKVLAANVHEAMEFLAVLPALPLTKAKEITIGRHVPCHQKALGNAEASGKLLGRIPGLRAGLIDKSCSGMGMGLGLQRNHRATSAAIARPMADELAKREVGMGVSECGACRLQMTTLSGKPALHPALLLAEAAGLG